MTGFGYVTDREFANIVRRAAEKLTRDIRASEQERKEYDHLYNELMDVDNIPVPKKPSHKVTKWMEARRGEENSKDYMIFYQERMGGIVPMGDGPTIPE